MPLRHPAQQMRDPYANAIAAAVAEGRRPSEHVLRSWVRYRDAADSDDPDATLIPAAAATAGGALLPDSIDAPTDPDVFRSVPLLSVLELVNCGRMR